MSLFSLSKQLLSPQQHYDWGLRALKTVLGIAGKLLRDARAAGTVDVATEAQLVIRATRVTTLPKLTFADGRRFADLLNDVYPGVKVSDVSDAELETAIKEVLSEKHYEDVSSQVEKVLQLHIACSQRIGIIIVGPSGSGKSSLWQILEGAYKKLGRPVRRHVMNPKAIHRQQLLGHMDMDTREWFDGVLTDAARQVVKESMDQHSWIICDGDVDPEWIESLNSVLDDNRLLTLPSGERIQFGSNVNFIFECDDLKFASPATVSRTAMLFLSEEAVDPSLIVKGWLAKQPEATRETLAGWCDQYFFAALDRALTMSTAARTTKVGTIKNALSHVAGADSKAAFARGLARGFGSNMESDARREFLSDLTRLTGEKDLMYVSASSIDRYDAPPAGIVDGKWRGLVMVDAVAQAQSLVTPWLESSQPFVLVGPEGCGKAMVLEDCFSRLRSTAVASLRLGADHRVERDPETRAVLRPAAEHRGVRAQSASPEGRGTPGAVPEGHQPPEAGQVRYHPAHRVPSAAPDVRRLLRRVPGVHRPDERPGGVQYEPGHDRREHPITTRFTAIAGIAYMPYAPRDEMAAVYAAMFEGFTEGTQYSSPSQRGYSRRPCWTCTTSSRARSALMTTATTSSRLARSRSGSRPCTGTTWAQLISWRRFGTKPRARSETGWWAPKARSKFDAVLGDVFRKYWRVDAPGAADVVFTTWSGAGENDKSVMGAMPADAFEQHVKSKLVAYEREVKELNILLFPEVLDRVARFNRVLSQPGGHLLLAGKAGVGRRTTTALVAYAHDIAFFSPKMTLATTTARSARI